MEAVCPDISQNLASLNTCYVMFLDVATTILSKFFSLSVVLPPPLFVYMYCALALPV